MRNHSITCVDSVIRKHPERGVIITGDFNWMNDSFLKIHYKFSQIGKVVTREQAILDKIWTNMNMVYSMPVTVAELGTSDHIMVLLKPSSKRTLDTGNSTRMSAKSMGAKEKATFELALSLINPYKPCVPNEGHHSFTFLAGHHLADCANFPWHSVTMISSLKYSHVKWLYFITSCLQLSARGWKWMKNAKTIREENGDLYFFLLLLTFSVQSIWRSWRISYHAYVVEYFIDLLWVGDLVRALEVLSLYRDTRHEWVHVLQALI